MKMKFLNTRNATLCCMMAFGINAFAGPQPDFKLCKDPSGRYLIQEFKAITGNLGNMVFIDTLNRENIKLFCGINDNGSNPNEVAQSSTIEIACVSSHLAATNNGFIVRARIHRQIGNGVPRLGVLEIQSIDKNSSYIDDVIPVICH